MFQPDEISRLDVEITNSCNALCPQCSRTPVNGTDPKLKDFLNFEIFKKQVSPEFLKHIQLIEFVGSTGDNAMHPDIYRFCEYVLEHTAGQFVLGTNGSMRDLKFWDDLGRLFNRNNAEVHFAIDGLRDTHELYKINANWDKVIAHADSFIKAGGNAIWQMIVFEHNQNQIEECEKLSKKMGFRRFVPMASTRFGPNSEAKVYNKGKFSHIIKKTTIDFVQEKPVKLYNQYDNIIIDCQSKRTKWVSIYADGTVWPCCYLLGAHVIHNDSVLHKTTKIHLKKYLKLENFDHINLHHHKIEDIIQHEFYQQTLPNSLINNPNPVCINECRKENKI
jgi:hypothetical protein